MSFFRLRIFGVLVLISQTVAVEQCSANFLKGFVYGTAGCLCDVGGNVTCIAARSGFGFFFCDYVPYDPVQCPRCCCGPKAVAVCHCPYTNNYAKCKTTPYLYQVCFSNATGYYPGEKTFASLCPKVLGFCDPTSMNQREQCCKTPNCDACSSFENVCTTKTQNTTTSIQSSTSTVSTTSPTTSLVTTSTTLIPTTTSTKTTTIPTNVVTTTSSVAPNTSPAPSSTTHAGSSCFDSGVVDTKDVGFTVPGFVLQGIDLGGYGLIYAVGLGDLNDDGFAEIGFVEHITHAGYVFLACGRENASLSALVDARNWTSTPGFTYQFLGWGPNINDGVGDVFPAGDVNGDGIDDFASGCPTCSPSFSYSGFVWVVFGSKTLFSSTSKNVSVSLHDFVNTHSSSTNESYGLEISSSGMWVYFGSFCSSGDVDGDGFSDVHCMDWHHGHATTTFGSRSPNRTLVDITTNLIGQVASFDVYGFGKLIDIDGDSLSDLMFGNVGLFYVVFGDKYLKSNTTWYLSDFILRNQTLIVNAPGGLSGLFLISAGDVNGDGLADALFETATKIYVLFCGAHLRRMGSIDFSTLNESQLIAFDRPPNSILADSTADVNGDGFQDLLFGTPITDIYLPRTTVLSYVIYGRNHSFQQSNWTSLNASDGFIIQGNWTRGGATISGVGDFNGDGADEIVVLPSRPEDRPGGEFDGGYAHLIYGCPPKSPLPTHTHPTSTAAFPTTTTTSLTTTVSSTTTSITTSVSTASQSTFTTTEATTSTQSSSTQNTTERTEPRPTTSADSPSTSSDNNSPTLPTTNLLSNPWFIAASVACAIVLVIILAISIRGCIVWWRKHKRRLTKVPVIRRDIDDDSIDGRAITSGLQLQTRKNGNKPSFERL